MGTIGRADMALTISALVLGILLALWFRVLVLVPGALIGLLGIGVDAWVRRLGFSLAAIMSIEWIIALQIGYVAVAGAFALISETRRSVAARFIAPTNRRFAPGNTGA